MGDDEGEPQAPFSVVDNAPDFVVAAAAAAEHVRAELPHSDAAPPGMDELLAAYYFAEAPLQVAAVEMESFAAA